MIHSFHDAEAERIFQGQISKKLPADIQSVARRKLFYLNNAQSLQDLRVPPGNQLEKLTGDRAGQHSIRVNDQWRICFVWQPADKNSDIPSGVRDVEIVDYH